MTSVRRFTTLLIISALVLVIFSAAIHGYRSASDIASTLLDRELKSVLQTLAKGRNYQLESTDTDAIIFQIWQDNVLISASDDTPHTPIAPFVQGYYDRNFNGLRWRVFVSPLNTQAVWMMVAQPMSQRYTIAEKMTESAITPFLITVPLLALFVFFSVNQGLSPLKRLSAQLSKRKENDLAAVELPHPPSELKPVISTLNSMLNRLHDAFQREQQFASNAAHELRTPLSVMKINLHNLSQELGEHGDKLKPLKADTDRMIHAVNQILVLSRTNPDVFLQQRERVDVREQAQQVITDIYSKVEAKHQEIELDAESIVIHSSPFTLYTLLQNLIANACNYSPEHALIRVTVHAHRKGAVICVEDSGPGIPETELNNVMARFYQSSQNSEKALLGGGLGLAIVGQIVRLHSGTISLGRSTLGGLMAKVILPVS